MEFVPQAVGGGFRYLHRVIPAPLHSLSMPSASWQIANPTFIGVSLSKLPRRALVRAGGFEPPRFSSLEPKSSASANSATPAATFCQGGQPARPRRLL